jgi:hypothetical protein
LRLSNDQWSLLSCKWWINESSDVIAIRLFWPRSRVIAPSTSKDWTYHAEPTRRIFTLTGKRMILLSDRTSNFIALTSFPKDNHCSARPGLVYHIFHWNSYFRTLIFFIMPLVESGITMVL